MSYDVWVIGGGPAGLSAALNVRARGKRVLVISNPLEENPLWRAELVDNCLGLPGLSGAELLRILRRHGEEAGAEFREGRVLSALRSGEEWYVSVGPEMERAGAVVLASGALRGAERRPFWAGASATAPPAMGCSTGAAGWRCWGSAPPPKKRRNSFGTSAARSSGSTIPGTA